MRSRKNRAGAASEANTTITDLNPIQWRGHGGFEGQSPPHFCQDGARDFLKIDRCGEGQWQIFREVEGVTKRLSLMPPTF